MDTKKIRSDEVEKGVELLRETDLPPTQVECVGRALRGGSSEDVQVLLNLISGQVTHQERFAKALLAWLAASQSAGELIGASLEHAAQEMEDKLLDELLGKR
jgi:hypothetical protein